MGVGHIFLAFWGKGKEYSSTVIFEQLCFGEMTTGSDFRRLGGKSNTVTEQSTSSS